jgi:hypothetical protein
VAAHRICDTTVHLLAPSPNGLTVRDGVLKAIYIERQYETEVPELARLAPVSGSAGTSIRGDVLAMRVAAPAYAQLASRLRAVADQRRMMTGAEVALGTSYSDPWRNAYVDWIASLDLEPFCWQGF